MAAPPLPQLLRTSAACARHASRRLHQTHIPRRKLSESAHRKEARVGPSAAIALAVLGTATYLLVAPFDKPAAALNDTTFTPYTITCRDVISPSSVLFTISPRGHDPPPPYLLPRSTAWKHPLWSVEFKQPEVQIARHYTPLPPRHDEQDARDGTLRFYVRAVAGGEMSNYLNRLRVGDDVHLRGPHPGFDILGRLGSRRDVVFLAGGTGIVPGMQVARAVLESNGSSRVTLLWAVRRRDEVQGTALAQRQKPPWWNFWYVARPAALTDIRADLANPSPVAGELVRLKARFGERLQIRLAVDEERTRFTANDVQSALGSCHETPQSLAAVGSGCRLHDQLLHARASESEGPSPTCQCDSPGKNLFMVSGPDGFVAHYAGEKIWHGGKLTQGPIGGVAAQLQRRNPSLGRDWLVLKL